MRLLVVNANTSKNVTAIVEEETRRHLPDGEIRAVTGTFGARVISTRAENAIAQHMLVTLMARHYQGCDAALIAVSFDTGLEAARELLPIPVVGMTEAALYTACMVAGRSGMVTFGKRAVPLYREVVDRYGLAARLLPLHAIEAGVLDVYKDPGAAEAMLVEAALALVEEGAEAVILSGAAMAGMPRKLQDRVPVPLIDGVACGVRLATAVAALGLPKPRAGSFAPLPARELVDVDPALAALFKG